MSSNVPASSVTSSRGPVRPIRSCSRFSEARRAAAVIVPTGRSARLASTQPPSADAGTSTAIAISDAPSSVSTVPVLTALPAPAWASISCCLRSCRLLSVTGSLDPPDSCSRLFSAFSSWVTYSRWAGAFAAEALSSVWLTRITDSASNPPAASRKTTA
jgi:hypothetical protein